MALYAKDAGVAGNANSALPVIDHSLDAVAARLEEIGDRLAGLRGFLEATADRVFGAVPKACESGTKPPSPAGSLDRIAEHIDRLSALVAAANDEAGRLSRL